MCPVVLIDLFLTQSNKLGHNADNDYNVGAKFERILPIHDIAILISEVPIKYDNYRKHFK